MRPVTEFTIDFRILAQKSGWNDPALRGAFYHGLNDKIKDELATRDEPEILDELIALAIRIDRCSRERFRTKTFSQNQFEPKTETPVPKHTYSKGGIT